MRGLAEILATRNALLTDYFGVAGVGPAFVNAGMLTLCSAVVYLKLRVEMTGVSIASLFLLLGFGLFGKNLLNIWPTVLGVFLYARFAREPFARHVNTAFLGAALAPIFSDILLNPLMPLAVRLPLSAAVSLLVGFILPPSAAHLFKTHMGFNLYNVGFAAGLIGTLVVALLRSYGLVREPVVVWTNGVAFPVAAFLTAVFASMVAIGFLLDRDIPSKMRELIRTSGRTPADFVALFGAGPTFVNMGACGVVAMVYILGVGGDLNGPVIGAMFTVVGFAAFGKHPRNIIPVMVGVFVGALAKPWHADDPSVQLAVLLATTLAPIAGHFGWRWGVVAGFLHSSAVLSVGYVHAGLNLYHNGFVGGIVAAVLVPVIVAVRRGQGNRR
ncbi:DUF1576 domain-containing protein [Micromonospora sp. S4605]|uniref:DUF1576 domain-containing protein n=1 Tax=Micromonospora sp. S4605 TaxID=1420897 RepID=UPI000D6EEA19|nr:DUF1576 domain-containing protein [Micromonospora sp. S4605]PWU50076.1 DUF1576 domain-containing protein [Micromonospora sp. S4605]